MYFKDGPIYIVKTARRRQFCDFYRQPINCIMKRKFTFVHLRGDSGRKFSTEKNRDTNARNKR